MSEQSENKKGSLYDFPKYYDLIFGSDWKAEFDFLEACFEKHAKRKVKRLFEPACGTGRLIFRLAKAGYDVSGNDLNPNAIDYCNKRFAKHGLPQTAVVGDMSDFKLKPKVDACFNTINSFRHLPTEKMAEDHLKCIAASLNKGGLYILGLHLIPTEGSRVEDEEWVARRGNLTVISYMWSKGIDKKKRMEYLGMTFSIYTPTMHEVIEDEMHYRTYDVAQMNRLLKKVPELEVVETYDFSYDMNLPMKVNSRTEDVVYILRRR